MEKIYEDNWDEIRGFTVSALSSSLLKVMGTSSARVSWHIDDIRDKFPRIYDIGVFKECQYVSIVISDESGVILEFQIDGDSL